MPRFISIAAIVLLPVAVFSQVQKGDNFSTADGSFFYDHSTYRESGYVSNKVDNFSYDLNWNMHHFVTNRLAIGPGFSLSGSNGTTRLYDEEKNQTGKYTSKSIGVGLAPSIRFYFLDSARLNGFAGLEGYFRYMWSEYAYSGQNAWNDKSKYAEYGGAVSVGMVYFFTRNVGLECMVKYLVTEKNFTGDITSKDKVLDQSVGLSVGMMIYLGKPKK